MANLFICGAGHHYATAAGTKKFKTFNDTAVQSSGGYLNSGYFNSGVAVYNRVRAVKTITPSPTNEVIWGFRWFTAQVFPLSPVYTHYLLTSLHYSATEDFNWTTTKQLTINITNDGALEARRGTHSGTLLGTSADNVVTNNRWLFIEFKAVIDNSAGSLIAKVNGVEVLNISGVDTQYLAGSQVNGVEFIAWALDDLYINDTSGSAPHNTFYGGTFHVQTLFPTADDTVAWTPSAGANWAAVDDASPDDVAWIEGTSDAQTDLYTIETAPSGTVLTLQVNIMAVANGSGVFRIAAAVKISGVTYLSTPVPITTSYFDLFAVFPLNPATSTAWTTAVINAAKWGVKLYKP